MIDPDALWSEVERRAPEPRKIEIPALRAFLAGLDCAHAKLLTLGYADETLDRKNAQELEAAIVGRIRESTTFSRYAAAECLRLIYDALRVCEKAGASVICFTRIADLTPPETSPFAPDAMARARPVEQWRQALIAWIDKLVDTPPTPDGWRAAVTLSAVLFGALVDAAKVRRLIDVLDERLPHANGQPFLEFHQRYAGLGDFHTQRWFVDPLTEMIFMHRPRERVELTEKQLVAAIGALIQSHYAGKTHKPRAIGDLTERAKIDWLCRAPRLDVEIISRSVTAHGLHTRSWARIFSPLPQEAPKMRRAAQTPPPKAHSDWMDDVALLFPWVGAIARTEAKQTEPLAALARSVLADEPADSIARTYIGWLLDLLAGHSATRDKLACSTILAYFHAVTPMLLGALGHQDPATMDSDSLADIYAELVIERDPGMSERMLAKGLREFQRYLERRQGHAQIKSLRAVLGDDAGLEPVDANVLTVEEYLRAREFLLEQVQHGRDPDDVAVCRIVMSLAFRTGMRRMEIFGLRMCDVPDALTLEIDVREHAGRTLKTKASTRILPARIFLSSEERRELRDWLERRRAEVGENGDAYLFATRHWGRVSAEQCSERIMQALCAATGHSRTLIHHLRHSFGTWLYLALRCTGLPDVLGLFGHLPKTKRFLRNGARMRKFLINHDVTTSRSCAFAVAHLMGHSGPVVSVGHYIHSSEFALYGITVREVRRLPRHVVLAASTLPGTTFQRLTKQGIPAILDEVRKRHPARYAEVPDKQPKPRRRGRPRKDEERIEPPDWWIPLGNIHGLLNLAASTDRPLAELSKLAGIESDRAQRLIELSRELGPGFGIGTALARAACPAFARYSAEIDWFAELESRIVRALNLDPDGVEAGLVTHLSRVNRQKRDTLFRGQKDETDLRLYCRFLIALGLGHERVLVLLRAGESDEVPRWAEAALKKFAPYRVRRIAPPTASRASTYGNWVGVHVLDRLGRVRSTTTQSVAFLALLVLLSRRRS